MREISTAITGADFVEQVQCIHVDLPRKAIMVHYPVIEGGYFPSYKIHGDLFNGTIRHINGVLANDGIKFFLNIVHCFFYFISCCHFTSVLKRDYRSSSCGPSEKACDRPARPQNHSFWWSPHQRHAAHPDARQAVDGLLVLPSSKKKRFPWYSLLTPPL